MKKKNIHKPIALTLIIAVVLCSAITVFAYLSANLGALKNNFNAANDPAPIINESFDNATKTDVSVDVGNPGYAVYVRAAIVVTWKTSSGDVLATPPKLGTDYSLDLNSTDWFEHGGYYYCKAPITPTAEKHNTPILINSAQPLKDAPESGYYLSVEIVSQTIQALGTTDADSTKLAVTDAWGMNVVGNAPMGDLVDPSV